MIRISSRYYSGSTRTTITLRRVATVTTTSYAGSPFAYGGPLYGDKGAFTLPNRDYDRDRPLPERDRDMSDWLNPYNEPETPMPPEYPFHEFNYGP